VGIQDIAEYAKNFIWGIDWGKVKERAGVDLPLEQLVLDPEGWGAYNDQIEIAFRRAKPIMDRLALIWEVPLEQVAAAKIAIDDGLVSRESFFWTAVNANHTFLASDEAVAFDTEQYRVMMTEMWINALEVAVGHRTGFFALAGEATAAEIVDSANKVHAFFEGVVYLADKGYLDPLKEKNPAIPPDAVDLGPVSGWTSVVIASRRVIGWTLVGAIAVLALYLVIDGALERYASMVDNCWERADREPDALRQEKLWALCQEQQLALQEGLDPAGIKKAVNTLAIVGGVGLLAYGAIMLMPHFAKSLRASRRPRYER
jgi:hypothetical protein